MTYRQTRHHRSFNEAALKRARKAVATLQSAHRTFSLQRSRAQASAERCYDLGISKGPMRKASTKPRSSERGKESIPVLCLLCHLASTKPRSSERGKRTCRSASIAFRFCFNEAALKRARKDANLGDAIVDLCASTKPRSSERGKITGSNHEGFTPMRFNEAALKRARKDMCSVVAVWSTGWLQRSRAQASAERPHGILPPDTGRRCFNEAALKRARKGLTRMRIHQNYKSFNEAALKRARKDIRGNSPNRH